MTTFRLPAQPSRQMPARTPAPRLRRLSMSMPGQASAPLLKPMSMPVLALLARVVLPLAMLALPGRAAAAPPALSIPHGHLGQGGSGVTPNMLLNLSLTHDDAGAAHRQPYVAGVEYHGYFNARLCYRYPATVKGSVQHPDLDAATGYFVPLRAGDARFECGGDSFSGNFLNWASMSTLDLLRYGLTGGDRVIDNGGLTVLQRAWLPDGAAGPDFYASAQHFPRKSLGPAQAAQLTPFGEDTLYIVSCRNRLLFSTTQKGKSCDAPRFGVGGRRLASDKYHGEFNARVQVCTSQDAAMRPDLCRAYRGGHKPEGAMQMSAQRLRIGIMSYLTGAGASDPNTYGGALRAALGPLAREVDPATGIAAASGAIAFVNRLGRSNPARLGAYRATDPGAELFYEALRYLQGRGPSVPAGAAADDGMPVLDSRPDPVLAACQRNIVATVGHPAFTADRYLPGNTRAAFGDAGRAIDAFAAASFDIMAAARKVGEMEADPGGAYGNPAPRPDLLRLDTLDDGPGGRGSRYLAGAAWWAHVHPVRKDKPVTIDSFALELGVPAAQRSSALYLAAKYGAFDDSDGDGNPFKPGRSGNEDAGRGGTGDSSVPAGFHSAATPQHVVDAVRAMFSEAGRQGTWSVGPSAAWQGKGANFVVTTAGDAAGGAGTVQRRTLTVLAGGGATVGAVPAWDAAQVLDGNPQGAPPIPATAPEARRIFTYTGSATVPFAWQSLPQDLRAMLDAPGRGQPADGRGALRTAWLRGDRSRELGQPGGMFRKRSSVLGDVVHSVPLIVGPPPARGDGGAHDAFREQHAGRTAAVYVGTGDGMLHAFSAADGAELFAFIPRALQAGLSELASPGYMARPQLDGSAAHADVRIGGKWMTALVSGMGMGAPGVFALDISNPADFAKGAGALWEFGEKDDAAIGHLRSAPRVARLRSGEGAGAALRDAVIVSSGLNSAAADGSGALFVLALDKPAAEPWRRGVNYHRLATPPGDPGQPNALSPPALVTAGDGAATHAYAGDLQGNLWRFDLGAMSVHRVFGARDDRGAAQPITHAPRVVFAPGGGYLVIFGTGKFIELADAARTSFKPQTLYAIHDRPLAAPASAAARAQLAQRTLDPGNKGGYTVKGHAIDYFGPEAKRGWYVDFPNTREHGERAAASPASVAGAIVLETLLLDPASCAAPRARLYVLDAVSGLAPDAGGMTAPDAETGQLAPAAAVAPLIYIDGGTTSAARSATGAAIATRSTTLLRPGSGGAAGTTSIKVSFPAKRLGWREVANWQELHDAASKK